MNDSVDQVESSKEPRRRMPRRLFWSITTVLLIVVIGLTVFLGPRYAARYIVAQELDKLGIVHEGVGTINVDLWNEEVSFGPVRLRKADAKPGQIRRFGLKLQLWNLFSRRAVVDSILIEGVDIRVKRAAGGAITINGVSLKEMAGKSDQNATKTSDGASWDAALEKLELRDGRLIFNQADGREAIVEVQRLSLKGFRTWEPEKPGLFDLVGRVNNIEIKANGEARPFANRITLAISGGISKVAIDKIERLTGPLGLDRRAGAFGSDFIANVELFDNGRIRTKINGGMNFSGVDISRAKTASVSASVLSTRFDLAVDMKSDSTQTILGTVSLKSSGLKLQDVGETSISAEKLEVSLTGLKASIGPETKINVEVTPAINAVDLKVSKPQKLSVSSAGLNLGSLILSGSPAKMAIKTAGALNLQGLVSELEGLNSVRTSVEKIDLKIQALNGVLAAPDPTWQAKFDVVVEKTKLRIDNGKIAQTVVQKITVRELALGSKQDISVAEISIVGLQADLTDKMLPSEKSGGTVSSAPASSSSGSPGEISVGRLYLVDSARIGFKDASVSPPINVKLIVEKFDVKNIDSAAPTKHSDLLLKAKLNEFTGIDVVGWASPFADQPQFNLKAGLTGLELPRFSSYAARMFGLNLETGQLNVEAVAKTKEAALDASAKINLKSLKFTPLSAAAEKKISGQVGMPVQTAVGLLQDSNKVINLTIPVGGTVAKPDIDLSDAIGQAIGGALKSLFPPTALASMLSSADGTGISFKPIPYASGSFKLGPAATRYADNLVSLLNQRPKLGVRICGRATAKDLAHFALKDLKKREAARKNIKAATTKITKIKPLLPLSGEALLNVAVPHLTKLAVERTKTIRRYILQKGKKIGGRVSECRSAFEPADKGLPRANVSL
jgi:hypothetical protein